MTQTKSSHGKKLIAIVGPTASGKTGIGVKLAKKFDGEIISADSRQIYRRLDIGSGKDLKQYDNVVYHLIDVADPGERFTLFDWLYQARTLIEDIFSRGKLPIVVGGTGLYVSALVEGYRLKTPSSKSKVQKNSKFQIPNYSRRELEEMGLSQLQIVFAKLKIANCKIDEGNPRRLIRAIERAQGEEEMEKIKPGFESLVIGIDWPREELYQRIDQVADKRFAAGMLEETRELLLCHPRDPKGGRQAETLGIHKSLDSRLRENDKGVNKQMTEWLVSLGLDYRIMTQYLLENGIDAPASGQEFEKMVERFKYAEHAYARRQLIWWRKRKNIIWQSSFKQIEECVEQYLNR